MMVRVNGLDNGGQGQTGFDSKPGQPQAGAEQVNGHTGGVQSGECDFIPDLTIIYRDSRCRCGTTMHHYTGLINVTITHQATYEDYRS